MGLATAGAHDDVETTTRGATPSAWSGHHGGREWFRWSPASALDAGGGTPVPLTKEALPGIREQAWSPDGRSVAFTAPNGDGSDLWIAATDGSGARKLELGSLSAVSPQWRPPDGDELLFVGSTSPGLDLLGGYHGLWSGLGDPRVPGLALHAVRTDGKDLRQLTDTGSGYDFSHTSWTPDGARIVTQRAGPFGFLRVVVLDADGTQLAQIEPDGDAQVNTMAPVVSTDGSRLAYVVMDEPANNWWILVRPMDASGPDTRIDHQVTGGAASLGWSPDGEILIVNHHYFPGTWLVDPGGGQVTQAPWTDPGFAEWQRLAP